jgi:hypothetical protein
VRGCVDSSSPGAPHKTPPPQPLPLGLSPVVYLGVYFSTPGPDPQIRSLLLLSVKRVSLQIWLAEDRVTYLCFLVLPEPYHCPKVQSSGAKGPLENKTGLPWKGEVQRFSAEIALIKNFRLALLGARERFGSDAGGEGVRQLPVISLYYQIVICATRSYPQVAPQSVADICEDERT